MATHTCRKLGDGTSTKRVKCRPCAADAMTRYRRRSPRIFKKTRRRYYLKHKAAMMRKNVVRMTAGVAFVRQQKEGRPCADCGESFHVVAMDFDHRPGCKKRCEVTRLARRGASQETLLKEIGKCDLVCANCHRVRSFNRRERR